MNHVLTAFELNAFFLISSIMFAIHAIFIMFYVVKIKALVNPLIWNAISFIPFLVIIYFMGIHEVDNDVLHHVIIAVLSVLTFTGSIVGMIRNQSIDKRIYISFFGFALILTLFIVMQWTVPIITAISLLAGGGFYFIKRYIARLLEFEPKSSASMLLNASLTVTFIATILIVIVFFYPDKLILNHISYLLFSVGWILLTLSYIHVKEIMSDRTLKLILLMFGVLFIILGLGFLRVYSIRVSMLEIVNNLDDVQQSEAELYQMVMYFTRRITFLIVGLGSLTEFIVYVYIITNSRNQKRIMESSLLDRQLFKHASNPMLILKNGYVLNMNQEAQKLFGLKLKEHDRYHIKTLINPLESDDIFNQGVINEVNRDIELVYHLNDKLVNGMIQISTIREGNNFYQLWVINDISAFRIEIQNSELIRDVFRVLISDNYWHDKIKEIATIIQKNIHPPMFYIYLQGFEGFYNYGVLDPELTTEMKEFYFDKTADQKSFQTDKHTALFLKLKTDKKQYGVMVIKLSDYAKMDLIQSGLKNIANIIAQYIETTILMGELAISEKKYKALIDNSLIGIIIYQDKKIKFANRKMAEITCFSIEELTENFNLIDIIDKAYQAEFREDINAIINEEKDSFQSEVHIYCKESIIKWLEIYATRFEYQRKQAVMMHIMDITAQVEMESQREKMIELLIKDQKMKAMRNLVAGLSHEFNNVFAIIKGYVDLMKFAAQKDHTDMTDDLDTILNAVKRGINITNRMHVIVRHEKIKPIIIHVNEFFEAIRPILMNLVRKKSHGISFEIDISEDASRVIADEFSLEEILHNLILNSLDAVEDNGRVIINIERRSDSHIMISVTDNGTGIDSIIMENIFDPFYTTKSPDQGTGLGLYIVYELVKSMEGHIEVESELGQGTTIKVILPGPPPDYQF